MDDAATYALLKSTKTTAVFQLESRGMKDLIRRLQPDRFGDIVALVALFRPGPLQSGMVEDFIARKHDTSGATIDYLHPDLKPVLAATYGVILYQEQVMQIAQILAGYTSGGADLLRRAMGKKKPEEMAKQRSVFVSGAVARGVREAQATHIFDLMEKFAGYGFNKSHSAAYALLSYQTAWLKAHYPAAYMAAVLSSDMDKTEKVVTLIDECNGMRLKVLPPDVNASVYAFRVAGVDSIRYGMGAIKGVGASAVEAIIEEREKNGPFESLSDLCRRIDLARVNRRVFEALIRSGSLDRIGPNRASLTAELERAMHLGEQNSRALSVGQVDLFGLSAAENTAVADWSEAERLAGERETLGLFLSGHPITPYEPDLKFLVSSRLADVGGPRPVAAAEGARSWSAGKPATVAGLVLEIRRRPNRVTLILDDRSARLEVSLYEEVFQQHRDIIVKDAILIIDGTLRFDDFIEAWRLQGKSLMDIDRARERFARRLWLRWPAEFDGPQGMNRFEQLLKPYLRGPCGVSVAINRPGYCGKVNLPDAWCVRPTRELLERLSALVGREGWYLVYGPRNDVRGEETSSKNQNSMAMNFLEFEQPIAELEAKIEELKFIGSDASVNITEEIKRLQSKSRALTTSIFANLTPWQITELARHPQRPYTLDYVSMIFSDWHELHGDRMYSDDLAIVGGLARIEGIPVMLIGHQKGRDTKERVRRNYGMPKPEGYRKALRLMKLAERFRVPVITLIDTPGAYPGIGSEERGQSEAIARNLFEMSHLAAPVLSVVIGEGGSGGALAIGVCDHLVMLQFSVYSVITPEACASILWKSTEKKEIAAEAMGGTAERLYKLGLVDEVLKEPHGGAHRDPQLMAETMKQSIIKNLAELRNQPITQLLDARQARLRGFGAFRDG